MFELQEDVDQESVDFRGMQILVCRHLHLQILLPNHAILE